MASHGSGTLTELLIRHKVRADMYNNAICSWDKKGQVGLNPTTTLLAELRCLPPGSIHPGGHLCLSGAEV